MGIEEIEYDNCDEMEFQPSLYIRTSDLPSTISVNQILNALENTYGPSFLGFDHKRFIHIVCPNLSTAKKLQKDGIDLGQSIPKIRVYNVFRHNAWLVDELK